LAYGGLCGAEFFGCLYLRIIVIVNEFFCHEGPVKRQNVASDAFA
jgi:hypothetical protein